MIRSKLVILIFLFFLTPTMLLAQAESLEEEERIYAIVKDTKGERSEGYLQLYPDEITVATKDGQEKSIPLKIIESIKVEKIHGGIPGADQLRGESYYSVRVQNSQEIFTLKKKITFSLNTSAGVVTKTLDPETSSIPKSHSQQPLIRGQGVALSFEIKF